MKTLASRTVPDIGRTILNLRIGLFGVVIGSRSSAVSPFALSFLYHLQDTMSCWSKIGNRITLHAFGAPFGGDPIGISPRSLTTKKLRPTCDVSSMIIGATILTELRLVTNGEIDRHGVAKYSALAKRRAVIVGTNTVDVNVDIKQR